jgi:hypothetical protein
MRSDTYFKRGLREVNSGAIGVQVEKEDLRVTITMHGDMDRMLVGTAYVTLRPTRAWTDASRWVPVFGAGIMLDGGVELHVRQREFDDLIDENDAEGGALTSETMIPVVVRDIYLPEVELRVRLGDLMTGCDRVTKGSGPRSNGSPIGCTHSKRDLRCPACQRAWWQERACA